MSSDTNIWKTGVNDNGNGTDNNQYFISDTSNAEKRLTIQKGTGNIGVGTNEPSELLDVSGNINLSGNIYLSNTGTIYRNGQEYGGGSGGSGGTSTLWTENSTKIYYNDGNVGINTNDPKERLEVVGNIKATNILGDGLGITNLDATNITSGTLDNDRLPTDISVTNILGDGLGITNLDATNITSGTLDNDRLPTDISVTNISGDGLGITNLDATNITSGTLDNDRLPANISITGDMTAKNLYVTGVTTNISTDTYQTENLEIVSIGADGPSLKITHDTSSHDVMQVFDANGNQSLTMSHDGNIGIGTHSPTAPLHIYDISDVFKVSNTEITISRNILPETNDTVDIGSAERKIRDMYISDNSLWIGDEHKLAVSSDGKIKFRKRKKTTLPKVLKEAGGNDEAALDYINLLHSTSYQSVTELKLNDILLYSKTLNPEYKTSEIFGDDTEDYDKDTVADAWQVNNSNIYLGSEYTNIGIGTNNPDTNSKLHINGNVNTSGTIYADNVTIKGSSVTGSGSIKLNCEQNSHGVTIKGPPHIANATYTLTLPNTHGNANQIISTDGTGNLSFIDNETLWLKSGNNVYRNDRVGINTSTPTHPLTIIGAGQTFSGALYGHHHAGLAFSNFNGSIWSTGSRPIGLKVAEGIICQRFYIMSDRRIKQNIIDIEDDEALITFRKLKPKKYEYIDKVEYGDNSVYGFIAQEVGELLPNSITYEKDYLPDVMKTCEVKIIGNNSQLILNENHDFKIGDMLRCKDNFYKNIDNVMVIEVIDDKNILVNTIFDITDEDDVILIYGKLYDDFNVLNKETIWTLTTSALQEVDKQLQKQINKMDKLIKHLNIDESIFIEE
jgi:hypothetical protein